MPTEELAAHPGVQAVARVLAEGLQPRKPKKKAAKKATRKPASKTAGAKKK